MFQSTMMDHTQGSPRRFGIYLVDEYPLYALVPLIEALRIANQAVGRRLYDWSFISENGDPVTAGAGMRLTPDASIYSDFSYDVLFIVAGNVPAAGVSRPMRQWLTRLRRQGTILAALDTGVFALAEVGLLEGVQATLHWEAMPMFRERFPDVAVIEARYVQDRGIITCAGGIAVLDLALELIARDHGDDVARYVANGFVHAARLDGNGPQRSGQPPEDVRPATAVERALAIMDETIEEPLPVEELAQRAGVSRRKLERMFKEQLRTSVAHLYLRVRLERARELLFYGTMPAAEIALACGFSSASAFSRRFAAVFECSPLDFRRSRSPREMVRFRPHLAWSMDMPIQPADRRSEGEQSMSENDKE